MTECLYIVMPAYNEEANISAVIEQWYGVIKKLNNNSKLVIVDDGSKDRTFRMMTDLCVKYPSLVPLTKKNSGHGATCMYAYEYALSCNADWIFQTDSDGQTDPDEFWQLWEAREKFDFIIGSRKNRMDGLSRIFVTKVLKLVVLGIYRINITDANTPFRLIKSSILREYIKYIPADFFLSNVLMSILMVKNKVKSKWIPIAFKPRQGGVNSINLNRIFKIGFKAIAEFKEVKKKL